MFLIGRTRQALLLLLLLIINISTKVVVSFNLLARPTFTYQPLNTKNRRQDELRLVTDLFVDSFWQGKVGGGAKELSDSQRKMLQAQQFAEFRKRYSRPSLTARMVVCKDTKSNDDIIGCAGVEVDTVPLFAEGEEPKGNVLGNLLGKSIPAKPTGRWDTKMQYAPLMSNLVVSRQYRRKGIAEKLVEQIEDTCREWDYDTCYLYVEKRNAAAVKLYQKLGYNTIWQDDKAKTLLPSNEGQLENSPTVIICMKKELGKGSKKSLSLWPF